MTTPSPAPRFEPSAWWKENSCSKLGVYGSVYDAGGNPLAGITIEVRGDDDTFITTSASDGSYNIYLGSLLDYQDGTAWYVQLKEQGQIVSEMVEWNTSRDCEDKEEIQIVYLEWKRKS